MPLGRSCVAGQQPAEEAPLATLLQVLWKTFLMTPPKAKTIRTISAAIPATSRPYSTADAPSSSVLVQLRMSSSISNSPWDVVDVGMRFLPFPHHTSQWDR